MKIMKKRLTKTRTIIYYILENKEEKKKAKLYLAKMQKFKN